MKKLCLLLSVIATISLVSGCKSGTKTETASGEAEKEGNKIAALKETPAPEVTPSPNVTSFDFDMPELDLKPSEVYDSVPVPTIEFDMPDLELNKAETYGSVQSVDLGEFNISFDAEDAEKLKDLDAAEWQELATKQVTLFESLTAEFQSRGLAVTVDNEGGTISLDSAVLFGGDSAELSQDGKDFLDKFVAAYTAVAYNESFDGFIGKVMVEGHIAPVTGTTYEGGMPLSTQRATNVKDYCLSEDTGISADYITKLETQMEAVGLSNSIPVTDEAGNVDIPASRRVSFRFLVQID